MADLRSYDLRFPRTVTEAGVVDALRAVHGLLPGGLHRYVCGIPTVLLEVRGTPAGITHAVLVPGTRASFVLGQLRAALPGLRVAEVDLAAPRPTLARELIPAGGGALRTAASATTNAGILAALQSLRGGEEATVQVALTPVGDLPLPRLRAWLQSLRRMEPETSSARPDEPHFLMVVRVGVRSDRGGVLLARVLGAVAAGSTAERVLRRRLVPSALVARRMRRRQAGGVPYPPTLAADEAAAVLGVPVEGPQLPGLSYVEARDLPPVPAVPRHGRVLGESPQGRVAALSEADSRRGLLLTSPTGAGKSTVLEHLCQQDFRAGRGVVVIESKGDLIQPLLDLVPKHRTDDVVVFDPADTHPVGFNLLRGGSEATDLLTDHVVSQFRSLYAAYLGPRSEMLLRAALLTLSGARQAYTVCEVIPLLSDAGLRRRLVSQSTDHVLRGIWSWFEEQSLAAQAEMVAPLTNKLAAFTLRRQVRAVVGQADATLDFERMLARRQILLVSLAKGQLGEDAAGLLGSVLLARLWAAVQARSAVPKAERHFTSVVLDEAQDFLRLPVALGDAVAQSRGMGVGWTVAHQNLGQLEADLRQAVLANLRSKLVFQASADDARTFAREFAPHLQTSDLQGLGPFEAYAALSIGASVAPPALIRTYPPRPPEGHAELIRQRSRDRFGADPAEVDQALRARVEGSTPPAPVGARRRS